MRDIYSWMIQTMLSKFQHRDMFLALSYLQYNYLSHYDITSIVSLYIMSLFHVIIANNMQ